MMTQISRVLTRNRNFLLGDLAGGVAIMTILYVGLQLPGMI